MSTYIMYQYFQVNSVCGIIKPHHYHISYSEKIYGQIFKPELTARFTNMNIAERNSLVFLLC